MSGKDENGICAGVYEKLPKCYETFPYYDYIDKIIIPGLVDLHVHAPQYPFRGLGMDLELIDWLNTHTYPKSSKNFIYKMILNNNSIFFEKQ